MKIHRIAVVVSHPIQHFCPQYSSWASLPGVELRVFFASKYGLKPYEDSGFGRTIQWPGIELDFPHEFLPAAEGRTLDTNIDSAQLNVSLVSFSPDVLIVYGYSQRLQRRALRWAEKNQIPVFMLSDSELRSFRSLLKRAVKALTLPRWYRSVRLFLTVGDANEAYYRNYGVTDDRLIRCFFPIDIKYYDSIVANRHDCRKRIRDKLGIPMHHKVILMVGKLVYWKRQMDLILFSNANHDVYDDVTVVLVGTGPEEARLHGLAKRIGAGGVIFAGFVSPDILAEFYCAADVYAHCSDHEPHSLAISEAIYCGLPVVLSDRCGSYGPSDDVRQGLNGYIYPCGEIYDMSRCLKRIFDDAESYSRMCDASQRIGRQHQALAHGIALTQAISVIDLNC
ncbi:glycosyltransferase [Methylococcus mesophilus]|uniref:glycosyltransferase n=1 Tax=Methylococcus mesophilus TaxID=2993564 RepID=UPI00224A7E4B|nr:glycosyltransferase [Methylococcus mesophilus]UZR28733.1 glycosyltransferase [Methylococcus mesophilus]